MSFSGRPVTATLPFFVEHVATLVDENPFLSIRDIEVLTSLSYGTIHGILHDHSQKKNAASRWVPHLITPKNKAKRLRFARDTKSRVIQTHTHKPGKHNTRVLKKLL